MTHSNQAPAGLASLLPYTIDLPLHSNACKYKQGIIGVHFGMQHPYCKQHVCPAEGYVNGRRMFCACPFKHEGDHRGWDRKINTVVHIVPLKPYPHSAPLRPISNGSQHRRSLTLPENRGSMHNASNKNPSSSTDSKISVETRPSMRSTAALSTETLDCFHTSPSMTSLGIGQLQHNKTINYHNPRSGSPMVTNRSDISLSQSQEGLHFNGSRRRSSDFDINKRPSIPDLWDRRRRYSSTPAGRSSNSDSSAAGTIFSHFSFPPKDRVSQSGATGYSPPQSPCHTNSPARMDRKLVKCADQGCAKDLPITVLMTAGRTYCRLHDCNIPLTYLG